MERYHIHKRNILFYVMAVIFCGCVERPKEKAVIVELQTLKVSREMGINDIYDTTRIYKAMFLKDSVCFIYSTRDKFNNRDIIQNIR